MGFHGPCKCMGSLFKWWTWGDAHQNTISCVVILILLIASGIGIFVVSEPVNQAESVVTKIRFMKCSIALLIENIFGLINPLQNELYYFNIQGTKSWRDKMTSYRKKDGKFYG